MKKVYFLAALTIFFWSTSATVSKLLLGSLDSFQVLWVSTLFAGLFGLVMNTLTGHIKKLKAYSPKDYLHTVLIGLPGTFLYYLLLYTGMDRMPASQALIINYLWPIMSVVFACIILKEKMTVRKGVAIGISFLGVVIVVGRDLAHFSSSTLWGTCFCILAAMCYGMFTALNQRSGYDKRISMMIFNLVASALTGVILLACDSIPQLDLVQTLGMAYNGIFNMAIAATAWAVALESGKTAKISNLAYITPFLSLVWTAIFLKEQISIFSIAGLVVIVLGIFVQLKSHEETG